MENDQAVQKFNDMIMKLERLIIRSDSERVKIFYQNVKNYCENKELTKTKIFKIISSHFICGKCKRVLGSVVLNCKHSYCNICFKNIVQEQDGSILIQSKEQLFVPKCIKAKCKQPIEEEKIQHLNTDLNLSLNIPKSSNLGTIVCKNCSNPHNIQYFCFTCRHNCIFCESFYINQGLTFCSLCNCDEFSKIFLDSIPSIKCSICKSEKVIEKYISLPCPKHFHCFNCLQVAWSINKCLKCKKSITPTLTQSFSILYKQCDNCENYVLTTFIYPKLCCKAYVCIFCQANSKTCLFCSP